MIVLYRFKLVFKIISISSCLALVYCVRSALAPRFVRVHNCALYSPSVQEQIINLIAEKQLSGLSAHNLYTDLQAVQKSIDEVKILYQPSKIAHVFVNASRPTIIIKDMLKNIEYVMANNQAIIARDTYIESVLEGLEIIFINSANFGTEVSSEEFVNLTRKIPIEIYGNYQVIWRSKTEICLRSKKAPLQIIGDNNSVINLDLIKYAELVQAHKKSDIKIDIRFKDMLVCAPEGGGK